MLYINLELDKEARAWDLYAHIEAQVRNMVSSLRAVSELQNPAIKDRHWQELMVKTRVRKYYNAISPKTIPQNIHFINSLTIKKYYVCDILYICTYIHIHI